jgi:response regulator RpfG family c-di-GMP phosphodiesterase
MLEDYRQLIRSYFDSELVAKSAAALSDACSVSLFVYDLDAQVVWRPDAGSDPRQDVQEDAGLARGFEEAGKLGSVIAVKDEHGEEVVIAPISAEEGCVGFLLCRRNGQGSTGGGFGPIGGLVDSFAQLLGEALRGRRAVADLVNEVSARYEELSLVYVLSGALDASRREEEALDAICETTLETLGADLLVLSVPALDVEIVFPRGSDEEMEWRGLCDALAARATAEHASLAVNHADADQELQAVAGEFAHCAVALLDVDNDLGFLTLLREDQEARFLSGDLKLLDAVARLSSVFMTNRKIAAARRQLFDASVFGLARLAESRDPETGEHLERVRVYTRLTAEKLRENEEYADEIDDEFLEHIYRSSPLHDIGKVGISDQILCKPGKLTAEEFEAMKLHSLIGGDTLRDIENRLESPGDTFLTLGRQIAYSHHEKWDGSGYPHGLAGNDIPLAARIMALADVYDALTQKRCYKPAFSHEKARSIIVEDSGRHFAPDVVEAFLAVEEQFVETSKQLQEPEPEQTETAS